MYINASRFAVPAIPERLDKVAQRLAINGFSVFRGANLDDGRRIALSLVPDGSTVMAFPSVTLDRSGISEEIDQSGRYDSIRGRLNGLHGEERMQELRRLGSTPQIAMGSTNAVTDGGTLVFGSALGNQLGAYSHGAQKVVLVVGAQKLVKDLAEAYQRLSLYALPLEDERARDAYGQPSRLSKILIIETERLPDRINVVLINHAVGF